MMGICSSCFGKSNKYLGQSPKENSFLEPDAEKLLPKEKIEKIVGQDPAKGHEKEKENTKDILIKAEGGDPGTFVDKLSETKITTAGCGGLGEDDDEPEQVQEPDVTEPGEQDLVQLTVSSMGSGYVLENVPETAEHEADETGEGGDSEHDPLIIADTSLLVLNKPTPTLRHHSFGSRTILGANPLEGNTRSL